jgi:hypothetical protein
MPEDAVKKHSQPLARERLPEPDYRYQRPQFGSETQVYEAPKERRERQERERAPELTACNVRGVARF